MNICLARNWKLWQEIETTKCWEDIFSIDEVSSDRSSAGSNKDESEIESEVDLAGVPVS